MSGAKFLSSQRSYSRHSPCHNNSHSNNHYVRSACDEHNHWCVRRTGGCTACSGCAPCQLTQNLMRSNAHPSNRSRNSIGSPLTAMQAIRAPERQFYSSMTARTRLVQINMLYSACPIAALSTPLLIRSVHATTRLRCEVAFVKAPRERRVRRAFHRSL